MRKFTFSLILFSLVGKAVFCQPQVTGSWQTLPNLMPINPVHVSLLRTGKILVVSGSGNDPSVTNYQAAIWDPQSGLSTTQPLGWDMFCNGMVVLPDGRPFVMGGTLQYIPSTDGSRPRLMTPIRATSWICMAWHMGGGIPPGRPSETEGSWCSLD